MPRRVTGEYRTLETSGGPVRAFVPLPLPPRDPALVVEGALAELHAEALAALGRLAVAGRMVPSTGWFLYGFVRKEAVISSQIEGTQATLRDVAVFEATERAEHPEDVEEVCNYVRALQHARARLREGEPIGTRLLCEAHALLMRGVRGGESEPGTIRTVQNWIGGARRRRRGLCHRRRGRCRGRWRRWSRGSAPTTRCRRWCARVWRTRSSRRSTRSLTATGVSGVC